MMDDILKQINAGEVSGVQFKERILDKYDIACELVAFSNSHGGKLVVGIKDKTGETNALSYSEVQETTNLLSDIASENVVPSILIKIDTVEVEDGNLVVATVKEGLNKPYHDNKGIVWVKNGADKRKVFDNAELAEMMTDCVVLHQTRLVLGMQLSTTLMQRPSSSFLATVLIECWKRKA